MWALLPNTAAANPQPQTSQEHLQGGAKRPRSIFFQCCRDTAISVNWASLMVTSGSGDAHGIEEFRPMTQVVEQTRDEKIAKYMKLTKRELVERLVNSNEALDKLRKLIVAALARTE